MCANPSMTDHGRLIPVFFEPVQLHLQAPDLTVKPVGGTFGRNRLRPALAVKKIFGLNLDRSLPLADLNRMDAVLVGYLDGLHATKRLQAKLGLELGWMKSALYLFSHWKHVSLDSVPLKHLSRIRGPLQIY
jgi:hypothetical protein